MKKTRSWFWFLVQLLPFFCFAFFMFARLGQGSVQYSNMTSFVADFYEYARLWIFTPVYNALTSVCDVINVSYVNNALGCVIRFVSYEVFVLFCRICYEVIAFLPKFCISFFERKM